MGTTAAASAPVDIGCVLDDGPYTRMQKLVVFMAAMAIVTDGFDGHLIGFAIPSIVKEWGITLQSMNGSFSRPSEPHVDTAPHAI